MMEHAHCYLYVNTYLDDISYINTVQIFFQSANNPKGGFPIESDTKLASLLYIYYL